MQLSRRDVLVSAAACALVPTPGLAAETTVPFLFEDARIYVPVRAAGLEAPYFILDTGAASCVLDEATAAAAKLAVHDRETVTGAGAGSSVQGGAGPVRLDIGQARLDLDRVRVSGLSSLLASTSGRAPGGIVGAPFFRDRVVEIDFVRNELRLHSAATDLAARYAASIPLDFYEGLPRAKVVLTLPSGRKLAAHVLVDLGAKAGLLLPEPFIESTGLRRDLGAVRASPLGAGLGGPTRYEFTRVRRIDFAAAVTLGADDPIIGLSVGGVLRSTWHEGLLGAEFLSRFDVAFDYTRARLLLRRRPSAPFVFDMSGLFLTAEGPAFDRLAVGEVLPGTPGAEADLRAGDEILAIDGARLSLPGARAALKAGAGRTVVVQFRRGAETCVARLTLRILL